jgi:hypothetical protein
MTRTTLVYRGVPYAVTDHPTPSATPVEHVYRGVHYSESLRHVPGPVDESVELHYRGAVYHHRRQEAAQQVRKA